MRLAALVLVACSVACRFPELPALEDDAATDAPLESCVDTGADTPDPRCPPDRPICIDGTCGGRCDADNDCAIRTDGREVCLDGTGACVVCDDDDIQAPPGEDECPTTAEQVCDGERHECRACGAHAECRSGVCDDGACVDPSNVVYLNVGGNDAGDCLTRESGCLTLQYAITKLTPVRRYLLFVPSGSSHYQSTPGTGDARFYLTDAHIIGYGAKLRNDIGTAIDIDNSNVEIEGLQIIIAEPHAIDCSGGSLVLRNMRISGAAGYGVLSTCDLTMTNNLVDHNDEGGLSIDSVFRIANNRIIGNGSLVSLYGGGRLTTSSTQSYFEFNTVAFNLNSSSSGLGDSLHCAGPVGSTIFRNNIIIGLPGRPHVTQTGVNNCSQEYTLFAPDNAAPGTGNMVVADENMFMFVDIGTDDYHLRPGSIAVGKGNASVLHAESMTDIDGDPRVGASIEVGADEIP